jgi:hypothetical protein
MPPVNLPVVPNWPSFAPDRLYQPILPNWFENWSFIRIDMGASANPALERHLISRVGSYGRQIGRVVEAVEVLAAKLPRAKLTEKEKAALDALTDLATELRDARREFARAD